MSDEHEHIVKSFSEDLIQLKKIKGVSGVISGKALYENTFSLDEALNLIS